MGTNTDIRILRQVEPTPILEATANAVEVSIRAAEERELQSIKPRHSVGPEGSLATVILVPVGLAGFMAVFPWLLNSPLGCLGSPFLFVLVVLVMPFLGGMLVNMRIEGSAFRRCRATKLKVKEKHAMMRRDKIARDLDRLRLQAQQEAARTEEHLEDLQRHGEELVGTLSILVERADLELAQAEKEFQARAFEPFWNCIVRAGEAMGEYYSATKELASAGKRYSQLLAGRTHSFPETFTIARTAPRPWPTFNKLDHLARSGQTDFEFASIWAQQQTRLALVHGFVNLEAAVRRIRADLELSIEASTSFVAGAFSDVSAEITQAVEALGESVSGRS